MFGYWIKIERISKEDSYPERYRTEQGAELILDERGMSIYLTEPFRKLMVRRWEEIEENAKDANHKGVAHNKGMLREEITVLFRDSIKYKGGIVSGFTLGPIIDYLSGVNNEIEKIKS